MAEPTLPTLTWNNSSVTNVSAAAARDVLTAIKDLVNASNFWIVEASDVTGGASPAYVEIRPRTTSDSPAAAGAPALPDQRIVLAADGLAAASQGRKTSTTGTLTSAAGADMILVNYAPEGGNSGSVTKDASFPDAYYPYEDGSGGDLWSTGYCGLITGLDGSDAWNIWLIESAEILAICAEDTSVTGSAASQEGGIIGPLWVAPSTSALNVDSGDRIYGMTLEPTRRSIDMWAQTIGMFQDHFNQAAVGASHTICKDPNASDALGGPLALISDGTAPALGTDSLQAADGTVVALDIACWAFSTYGSPTVTGSTTGPDKYIGRYRQIMKYKDTVSRGLVKDGAMVVQGIIWGSAYGTSTDAIIFTNS